MAIKRTQSKTGQVRYYQDGKRLTEKQGAVKYIRQQFSDLAQNPLKRSNLTTYEARVFRNSQNAKKGRDLVSDFAKSRYRFDGKFVPERIFKDNPLLQRIYKSKDLNSYKEFQNLTSWSQVSDLLENKIIYNNLPLSVLIKNDEFRPRQDVTFKKGRLTEIYALLNEINAELKSKGKPPYALKVVTPSGLELTGRDAVRAIESIVEQKVRERSEDNSVYAAVTLPYRFVWPFMVVDLAEFEENIDAYLDILGS